MAMEEGAKSLLEKIMEISISDPVKYKNIDNLLPEIRKQISPFYSQAKFLSLKNPNKTQIGNGDLVYCRGAIQNDHQMGMHNSSIPVKLVDGRETSVFPIFVDSSKIAKTLAPKQVPDSCHRIYTVMAIPGESEWASLKPEGHPTETEPNSLANAVDHMNIADKTTSAADKNLLLIRVYEQQNNEFLPNEMIEFYGIYYDYFRFRGSGSDLENGGESELDTQIDSSDSYFLLPNVHIIEHRILRHHDLVQQPQVSIGDNKEVFEQLLSFAHSLFGYDIGTNYFLSALVAKAYDWHEDHSVPLCTIPMAFLNVRDSRPFIEAAKLLLPLVQVVPMSPQILQQERLFSSMDHQTGMLVNGRLQVVRGTLLILDFTHYTTSAKVSKDNFVRDNVEALQRQINEQKLNIDYGPLVQKYSLQMDVSIVALCPGLNTYFLKFPTLVPLPIHSSAMDDGLDRVTEYQRQCPPGMVQNLRWHLRNGREQLDKITLDKVEQQLIVETFTDIRQKLGTAAVEHFRHLLSLTRINTALTGHSEMSNALYQFLLVQEYKRLEVLRALNLA